MSALGSVGPVRGVARGASRACGGRAVRTTGGSQVERQDEAEDRRCGREPEDVRQQHRTLEQDRHAIGGDELRLREGVIRRLTGEERAVAVLEPLYAPWSRPEAPQEGVPGLVWYREAHRNQEPDPDGRPSSTKIWTPRRDPAATTARARPRKRRRSAVSERALPPRTLRQPPRYRPPFETPPASPTVPPAPAAVLRLTTDSGTGPDL
jgi:hypothetical protein